MKQRCGVSVAAEPETIFGLLERDRTGLRNDELMRREPVGDRPFGPGYRYRTVEFHRGHLCLTDSVVTAFAAPFILQEEWEHRCRALAKVVTGSNRFEIVPAPAGSIVLGEFVQRTPGLARVLAPLFASVRNVSRAQLTHLGMRAEAITLSP